MQLTSHTSTERGSFLEWCKMEIHASIWLQLHVWLGIRDWNGFTEVNQFHPQQMNSERDIAWFDIHR